MTYRIKYASGLGSSLYVITVADEKTRMFFIAWCSSFLPNNVDVPSFWRESEDAVEQALSVQWKEFPPYTMWTCFFFDCMYLVYLSSQGSKQEAWLYSISNYLICRCSFLSRHTLNSMHKIFIYKRDIRPHTKTLKSLLKHKTHNELNWSRNAKHVLVVANVSAGKSTLINSLVGYRLTRAKATACTSRLAYIQNKIGNDGVTILDAHNHYRWSQDMEKWNSDSFVKASLPFNSSLSGENICLIDTPGYNNSVDESHKRITKNAIESGKYEMLLYISNCQYFGTDDEYHLLRYIWQRINKPIIFVLNKLDSFKKKDESIIDIISHYDDFLISLGFKAPVIIPVSAKAALEMRLSEDMLDEDERIERKRYERKFSDSYYDLPSYVSEGGKSIIERTGIKMLERALIES